MCSGVHVYWINVYVYIYTSLFIVFVDLIVMTAVKFYANTVFVISDNKTTTLSDVFTLHRSHVSTSFIKLKSRATQMYNYALNLRLTLN